jgi:hypothetical protein
VRKSTAYFRFGPVRQEAGSKHLRPGDLVEAVNVKQTTKAGVFEKRLGFSRTAATFTGGTLSGTPSSVVASADSTTAMMRDTGDQLWSATTAGTWSYQGKHPRVYTKAQVVDRTEWTFPNPTSCIVGSTVWCFSVGTDLYKLHIQDLNTGVVTTDNTSVTATAVVNLSAVYDGTNVWVFWVARGAVVKCHKFVVATPTVAPTSTTFCTIAASSGYTATLAEVKAQYLSTAAKVFVCFAGAHTGANARHYVGHAYLDPATGAAAAATGVVASGDFTNVSYNVCAGLCICAGQTGSGASIYYSYFGRLAGGDAAKVTIAMVKVTASTLAVVSVGYDAGYPGAAPLNDSCTSSASAMTSGGLQFVAMTNITRPASPYVAYTGSSYYYTFQNGALVGALSVQGSPSDGQGWIASEMELIGSTVYWITGYDDIEVSSRVTGTALITESFQRTYFMRCASLTTSAVALGAQPICGTFMIGEAAPLFNMNTSVIPAATSGVAHPVGIPKLLVNGTKLVAMVGALAVTVFQTTPASDKVWISRVEIDTAKVWGKDCLCDGLTYSPGGVPIVRSSDGILHEISPMLYPSYIYENGAGVGSVYAGMAIVYAIYDANGRVWRSTPCIRTASIGTAAGYQFPTLKHALPGTTVVIEIYLGTTSTLKLQESIPMSQWAGEAYTYASWSTPALADFVNGEILYTTGGSLTQTWPQQCQMIGAWKNRLFLGQDNYLWFSQEFEGGKGLLFNEVLRRKWGEVDGTINGMGAVNYNYLALFGANSVGVLLGDGPDNRGSGANYAIQTLSTKQGLLPGGVCLPGPDGCYFQDAATGRVSAVLPDLQVKETWGGAYDYASETILCGVHYEKERMLLLYTASRILCLDFQHRNELVPYGYVYAWTGGTAVTGLAVAMDSTGLFHVVASGNVYRPNATNRDDDSAGAAVDYRMKIKTGHLQPGDLQGEFDVNTVQLLGTYKANCSLTLTTYPDYAASGTTTTAKAFTAAPLQLMTKPPNCMRVQALQLEFNETDGTGAALEFEGFAVEYTNRGHMKRLNTSQVVA